MTDTITRLRTFLQTQGKGLSLLLTMLLGALVPQAHAFSFLIQDLLMVMLFFAFLDIEFKPRSFQKSVLWVLLANVLVAFLSYIALASFNNTLALAAFMTAIAPTAIAAPVIISFIQREVEYVVAAVMVTNIASAVIVPLALPSLLGAEISDLSMGSAAACVNCDVRAINPLAACCVAAGENGRFYSQG
ncbi:MAG: hypothetical protein QM730_27625 [Anaerolineales bacterium]